MNDSILILKHYRKWYFKMFKEMAGGLCALVAVLIVTALFPLALYLTWYDLKDQREQNAKAKEKYIKSLTNTYKE